MPPSPRPERRGAAETSPQRLHGLVETVRPRRLDQLGDVSGANQAEREGVAAVVQTSDSTVPRRPVAELAFDRAFAETGLDHMVPLP